MFITPCSVEVFDLANNTKTVIIRFNPLRTLLDFVFHVNMSVILCNEKVLVKWKISVQM